MSRRILHSRSRFVLILATFLVLASGASSLGAVANFEEQLDKAIYNGATDLVKELLKEGASKKDKTRIYSVAALEAARMERLEIIKLLLDEGANPNLSFAGGTPLITAAENCNLEMVKLLIAYGADVNMADAQANTAISRAVANWRNKDALEIFRLLKARGALFTICDAVRVGDVEEVGRLVRKGADVNQNCLHKYRTKLPVGINKHELPSDTPLQVASRRGHKEIVQLLIAHGAEVNDNHLGYSSALYNAAINDKMEIVNLLLRRGAKPNLFVAVKLRDIAWIKQHFDNGAPTGPYCDQNPLYAAAKQGDFEIVELLVENGVDVNPQLKCRDVIGIPLIGAAKGGDLKIVKHLLSKGADANFVVTDGGDVVETASTVAAGNGDLEILKVLLQNMKKKDLTEELLLASKNGHHQVVEMLLRKGVEINNSRYYGATALMLSSYTGKTDVILLLIKNGADLEARDDEGKTALLYAAGQGNLSSIKTLIQHGADLHVKDNGGCDALIHSAISGNVKLVAWLVSKGFDISYQSCEGFTPIMAASSEGHIDMVKYLLENGASAEAKSYEGFTALDYARKYNRYLVAKYLITKVN